MIKIKTPDACPFGLALQHYWDNRYALFSRFDEGIQIDAEGLHCVMPEAAALEQARLIEGEAVLDGFAGVGGSAIAFARAGKRVMAVELDAERIAMAAHNARIYGVAEHIQFMQGDFFAVASQVQADAVHLDPPWGWPRVRKLTAFGLENFAVDGIAMLNLALERFKQVILRVPAIFDVTTLAPFQAEYAVYDDRMGDRVISKSIILRR